MRNEIGTKSVRLKNKKLKKGDLKKIDIQNADYLENSSGNKKNNCKRICMTLSRNEEKKINDATEHDDKLSIFIIVIILACCFVVGIYLGWLLYNIAINGAI